MLRDGVSAAAWKADVEDDGVEVLRVYKLLALLSRGGRDDGVTELPEPVRSSSTMRRSSSMTRMRRFVGVFIAFIGRSSSHTSRRLLSHCECGLLCHLRTYLQDDESAFTLRAYLRLIRFQFSKPISDVCAH